MLQVRLDSLEAALAAQRAAIDEAGAAVPRLFLTENEYTVAIVGAEATWVRSLLGELTTGTHPDLDRWRAWHQSGEIPADLAALAERGAISG